MNTKALPVNFLGPHKIKHMNLERTLHFTVEEEFSNNLNWQGILVNIGHIQKLLSKQNPPY